MNRINRNACVLAFFTLIFQSQKIYAATDPCRFLLSDPLLRNSKTLKRIIFAPGDNLLRTYFTELKGSRSLFYKLDLEQKRSFVSAYQDKIYKNLIKSQTELESIAHSKSYFAVNGGQSRLGRIATGLKKMGINVFLDFQHLDSEGLYMYDYKTIVLGLEEALYPNELSFNFLNLAQHAWNYEHTLTIPMVYDKVPTKTVKAFAVDELIVFEKEIFRMQNLDKTFSQNSQLSFADYRKAKIQSATDLLRELSIRLLLKKYDLLKAVNYLKKIEKDPSLLQNEEFLSKIQRLGPELILDLHSFEFMDSLVIQKKARASIELIEKSLGIAEKVFD